MSCKQGDSAHMYSDIWTKSGKLTDIIQLFCTLNCTLILCTFYFNSIFNIKSRSVVRLNPGCSGIVGLMVPTIFY